MDNVEFEPYEKLNPKRIGTGSQSDDGQIEKRSSNKNKFKPSNFKIIIGILIIFAGFISYKFYQNTVLYPEQTNVEMLEIRNGLYNYKESFGVYPNQLTELVKSRPLRETWITDAWGNAYRYKVDDTKQSFVVSSSGYDGTFGTDDDFEINR